MITIAKYEYTVCLLNNLVDKQLEARLRKLMSELDISVIDEGQKYLHDEVLTLSLDEYESNTELSIEFLIEEILKQIDFSFNELPFLLEGESKILRKLNDKIVVELFKPTVYSYTQNRYGTVEGTEMLRAKFTSQIFREMNKEKGRMNGRNLNNAFLACKETNEGILVFQRLVAASNLEVRVKRYHIGSPVHRYKYTDQYPSVQSHRNPLKKWDRFEKPLVCFDWRLPLTDEDGNRLADEPISDDYASIWISDVASAKKLARTTFEWMEEIFSKSGLILIDICFFIDESGKIIFGEISPDCMRVREGNGHPKDAESYDKDLWRNGEKETFLANRYERLYELIFNQ